MLLKFCHYAHYPDCACDSDVLEKRGKREKRRIRPITQRSRIVAGKSALDKLLLQRILTATLRKRIGN